jgi:Xaa-Pro aminopeptidase
MSEPTYHLTEISWPDFGSTPEAPSPPLSEFQSRLGKVREQMEARGLTHLVVYGDREHFANLAYLTNFDPRFEEALLVVRLDRDPLLIVGNECEGYLPISPLWQAGLLRAERFQDFSLLNQPRSEGRPLTDIFCDENVGAQATVGCVGWKYYSAPTAIDLPAYIVDTLRSLTSHERVVNATDLFMHPGYGFRSTCSPVEIAFFEYAGAKASAAMTRLHFSLRPGMTDFELAASAGYDGTPLACHSTLAVGWDCPGLSSPSGRTIKRGEPMSGNVAYWGSNVCRAGWVAESDADLPPEAKDYVAAFVGPYFEAMAAWLNLLRIGQPGKTLDAAIHDRLPFDRFGIFLNCGHLIHLDEWLSSPIYRDSELPIRSGMIIQIDVIPTSPVYYSTRLEDGLAIADASLRSELNKQFPECYARCIARRNFMESTLGLNLPEEILPLSNMTGILPPFLLRPNLVLALTQ